jgi:PrcB C-terminal
VRLRPASPARVAAIVATLILIAGGVVWTQVVQAGSSERIAWQDVTARMGPVLWPKSVTRSFWKQRQLTRYLARTFPEGLPAVPHFDFTRRKLILVAAGPRSSTGYGVEIVRVTGLRSTVRVLAREKAPSLWQPVTARLTSPYCLITIPATSKRVYVQWRGRP